MKSWSAPNIISVINSLKFDIKAKLKLKVAKSGRVNPQTKAQRGQALLCPKSEIIFLTTGIIAGISSSSVLNTTSVSTSK